jgi:hypothetical protein
VSKRIRWHEEDYESFIGYIGNFEPWAYQVWKSGEDWSLMSQLPGDIGRAKRGSLDELKAEAERWLEEFVSSLGAIFPEDKIGDEEEKPIEVTWAAGRRVRYAHPDAGYPGERERTADCLTLGEVYTIAWADIGQSRTDLNLITRGAFGGIPAGRFNSVFFEPADDEEAAQ